MNIFKTRIFLLISIILFAILLIIIISLFFLNLSGKQQVVPTPTPKITTKAHPPAINDVPSLPEDQGGGIDLQSTLIQNSIVEIKKLYPYLPYEQDIALSTGETVSILIPGQDLQENTWVLTAQIFNLNYNTSPDQEDYELTRKSFIEAANIVFSWVKTHEADPNKILFSWGDRKFIQDQTEAWLKEGK